MDADTIKDCLNYERLHNPAMDEESREALLKAELAIGILEQVIRYTEAHLDSPPWLVSAQALLRGTP